MATEDFLSEDYKLKVDFLKSQFDRLWTRFNYFLTVEMALFGALGFVVFEKRDFAPVPLIGLLGLLVSSVWYIVGAQDREAVDQYRQRVDRAANLVAGAEKGERAEGRLSYRSGYYPRSLITRVGKLELRIPQDRSGRFSTEIFERYQRSEKALVAALTQMYIQGVSTRKVKAISEELCGHSFSASAVSEINMSLFSSSRITFLWGWLVC